MTTEFHPLRQPWVWHDVTASISEYDPAAANRQSRLLGVSIDVDSTDQAVAVRAFGPFVYTDQLQRVVDDVNAHAEWSDERVLQVLRERGAHFTPDQVGSAERLFEGRLAALGPFVGRVQSFSIEFDMRKQPREPGEQAAELYWRAEVSVAASPGRPSRYIALFEPFEGRLIALSSLR